jgi:thiamine-phosphate pyrophosphorylase
MRLNLSKALTYLITSGATTAATTSSTEDFSAILKLVSAAVSAEVSLIQLREKNLSALVLYELTKCAVALTKGSNTRLLVNDRADIAKAAGADGVHLTSTSLRAATIRRTFGRDFLVGVSAHSLPDAVVARDDGADFVVLGPVFETASKRIYGEPLGLSQLENVIKELKAFPVIALGGITLANAEECLRVGAAGVAGITIFNEPSLLAETTEYISRLSSAIEGFE